LCIASAESTRLPRYSSAPELADSRTIIGKERRQVGAKL
jgi:hypothetical protein